MSKDKKDDFHDQLRVYRGVIPWSVTEYDWVIAAFEKLRPMGVDHLPFPEEYADLRHEMKTLKGEELENIKDLILFSHIFRQRYPKKLEYDAHFYRFNQINKFMQTYYDELEASGLVSVGEGKDHVESRLIEVLCTMLYDEEDFDESGEWIGNTFAFKDVIAQAKPKMNKKAVPKPQNEDAGFRGLIPWSVAEFNWVLGQHAARRMETKKNQDRADEYLPVKLQMMRQTGKGMDNFETMVLLNEIFHERYPNRDEAMAHFFRYRSIFQFLDKHKNELIKEGFAGEAKGDTGFEPELIDSLCVLPYSREQTEKDGKSYTYLYTEVVARTRAKISARLN